MLYNLGFFHKKWHLIHNFTNLSSDNMFGINDVLEFKYPLQ